MHHPGYHCYSSLSMLKSLSMNAIKRRSAYHDRHTLGPHTLSCRSKTLKTKESCLCVWWEGRGQCIWNTSARNGAPKSTGKELMRKPRGLWCIAQPPHPSTLSCPFHPADILMRLNNILKFVGLDSYRLSRLRTEKLVCSLQNKIVASRIYIYELYSSLFLVLATQNSIPKGCNGVVVPAVTGTGWSHVHGQ